MGVAASSRRSTVSVSVLPLVLLLLLLLLMLMLLLWTDGAALDVDGIPAQLLRLLLIPPEGPCGY